jgi:hypothetical protein
MPQLKRRASKKPPSKPLRVSVVLERDEYDRLSSMAEKSERSMSWLGRYAIRKLLQEHAERQLPLRLEIPGEA